MSTFRVAVRPNVSMDNLAIHRPHLAIYDQTVGIAPSAACDRDIANRLMTCAVISMDSPFHFAHCNCCFRSSSRQLMTVDPTLRTTLSPTV
ncbi:Small ribosomal subunit protein uS4c [Trichinella pseudospiralis]